MYYVAHKSALSEVFVLDNERVQMNTVLALCGMLGIVFGIFIIGTPSMRERTDGQSSGQRADYLTFAMICGAAWLMTIPWALDMRHTVMTKEWIE